MLNSPAVPDHFWALKSLMGLGGCPEVFWLFFLILAGLALVPLQLD